ncbi:phospholipid phosphatase-related protein type 4 [Antennarius striatus]|uniref:phospholipid phosphatase-related protein type 4 n=1 Tax=Antennarius striatus TaxID=241820 RepID=UPI0035B3EEF2
MLSRGKGVLTKDSVSLLPCFYFVELPILVSSVVSLYFLEWTDVFKPMKTGFICHDRGLSLPYIDPNHEVIPLLMLLSLAFAGPAIAIMFGEAILFCCRPRGKSGAATEASISTAGCNFNSFLRRAFRFIGVHAFGLCATALITDILQLMTGYPTPYFLTVCKPNYTLLSVSCERNPYVMEDICSGTDPTAINQGRKSFPSQHATLASFAAVYVSMYFNSTLTDSSKLLKPLLVFSIIVCAIICGLTRIIQYKNHATDVYLGFLLGGSIAVYLGLYAVSNFQPSEEASTRSTLLLHHPPCSFPHITQDALLHHPQIKASIVGKHGLPSSHSEGLLHIGHQQQRLDEGRKGSGSAVEAFSPYSPPNRDAMVTCSHTLPRVHTPQAMAAYEEAARHHAVTLHHASMDTSRSKQLLSQWKSKNSKHQCSLQVPDSFSSSVDSSSGQSSQHPYHHGSMDLQSAAVGLNGGFDPHAYMSALTTGTSATLPSNCSGITGGARIAMQSRPGSSQLVHIPEEAHENYNATSPKRRAGRGTNETLTSNSTAQANWQKAAEKTTILTTNGRGANTQPRIAQVIALSKQQDLLKTHSKSLDESTTGFRTSGSYQGSAHYKALTDQDPTPTTAPSPLGSTSGSVSGSTGAVVRVDAHPEHKKPVIQAPSMDGSGSWRWCSVDHAGGVIGGAQMSGPGGVGGDFRQSFELSDPSRDSESANSVHEGSNDSKHANQVVTTTATMNTPSTATVHTQNTSSEHGPHTQGPSTIRVTPGDGSGSVPGGRGGAITSETPSTTAPSHESTLQRRGNNIVLIPERADCPDSARNIFYKGTSIIPVFKD